MSGFIDIAGASIGELEDETPGAVLIPAQVTGDRFIAMYRRLLAYRGTDLEFRRLPNNDRITIKGVVSGLRPDQLAAGVEQGSWNGIVLATNLEESGTIFADSLLKKRDRVKWRNEFYTITHDPETLMIGEKDVRINFIFKG